ncbi:MAG: medium chain dehydrogenase/reductase family protein [Acidimicrobiales bacterium]
MQQVVITQYGGPEVLKVREAPDPTPMRGEIRIAVAAAGLNFADVSARVGLYADAPKPPMTVGYEVSGVVDAVGGGVEEFAVGDRVLALTRFGGQSSSVVVPVHQAVSLPAELDLVHAAAIPVNYLTAYLMLVRLGSVREGQSVLIHAAAGGVGFASLQICRKLGAVTYGTASAGKHERLREAGLDHPIDYRTQDFAVEVNRLTKGRGVDVILDAVGGATTRKNYALLRPMGRLFMFGASSTSQDPKRNLLKVASSLAQFPIFHPIALMNANKGVFGINLGHLWEEKEMMREVLTELLQWWADGIIEPVVDSTFPFSRAGDAHDQLQQARNIGKVLLIPD